MTNTTKLKCLYLIQANNKLPEIYDCLREKDYILLSYTEETEDTDIFYPNSTWTTGRNKLREYALSLEKEYDYYICLDEDIVFEDTDSETGFNTIEKLLLEYTPFIAVPYWEGYNYYAVNNLGTEAQSTTMFDGLFDCFSKAAFMDNKLLPYVDIFDSKSWWDSNTILIRLCKYYYNNQVVVFNNIKISNTQSSCYPTRGADRDWDKGWRETRVATHKYVANLLINNKEIDESDVISKLGEVDDILNQTGLIEIKKAKK